MGFKSNKQIIGLILRLWNKLGPQRRKQFWIQVLLMLMAGFTEIVSLSSVIPFLGVLIEPERVFNYPMANNFSLNLGINSSEQLVLPLTLMFLVVVLLTGINRIFLLWSGTRLAFATGGDLGLEAFRRTLYQPYKRHLNLNSSYSISGVTSKVNNVVFGILFQLLTVMSSLVLMIAIGTAMILVSPYVAILISLNFLILYIIIIWVSRKKLEHNSLLVASSQDHVIKLLQEGFGGIRDILIDGTQEVYCKNYRLADEVLKRAQGTNAIIGGSPRYIMELFGIIIIVYLSYNLSRGSEGISVALPLIGALVFGAQRLLPTMQQIFSAWSSIVSNKSSLSDLLEILELPLQSESLLQETVKLKFQETITFSNIYFRYDENDSWCFNCAKLVIPKGKKIGIVGGTGSGKSTFLDLLMGLLQPNEGEILVDGVCLNENNIRTWQKNISHVPQNIYLSDGTIEQNIAFELDQEKIDFSKIKRVSSQSQIDEFIERLNQGYQTCVGENGIRLSGGQRQRIGIARALYKNSTVLIFDEATSALDSFTEKAVMNSIMSLSQDLTILIIAHRITTVKQCDLIVEINNGKVVNQGTFEKLLHTSKSFNKIVNEELKKVL